MSKSIMKLVTIILAGVCFTAAAGCAHNTESATASSMQSDITEENSKMNYTEYVKNFGIDLTGMTIEEDGEIKNDDEYAYICFTLKDGKCQNVEKLLSDKCGKIREVNPKTIPAYLNHRIALKMKSETMIGTWKIGMSGKDNRKSRILTFYLTEQKGTNYLYLFG